MYPIEQCLAAGLKLGDAMLMIVEMSPELLDDAGLLVNDLLLPLNL